MCRICGWFEFNIKVSLGNKRAVAEHVNATLAHRGPDGAGVMAFDNASLAISRLIISDLTTGHQPIANEGETRWIAYNGEIYNFLYLRCELEPQGYCFRTRSATEVILHAYEAWGLDCVRRLRGMLPSPSTTAACRPATVAVSCQTSAVAFSLPGSASVKSLFTITTTHYHHDTERPIFADVSAFVFRSEGFGQVGIDAMAAGKPVVTKKIPPLTKIVVDGETGFLMEPDNLKAFADAIL